MDPSIIKCIYKDSFDTYADPHIILHTYVMLKHENTGNKKTIFDNKLKNKKTDYYDIELNNSVNSVKTNTKHANLFDPFKHVSVAPFMNRDAIILSNIDAIFNFNKHTSGYIIKQETKDFNFASINDGPGGFTEYMFYRNPNSYGYGMTSDKYPYNTNLLDLTRFNITYGQSGKGDLKQDYKSFIKYIRTVEAVGVNVVLGNIINNNNEIEYMLKLIIALGIIKIGGTFVSKIPHLNTKLMTDLLYITSQCFNKITLFEPLSTDITDNIYYIVAEDAKRNNIEWVSYLEDSYTKSVKDDLNLISLIENVPSNFIKWITEYNNLILLYKKFIFEQVTNTEPLYDTYKCKAIWNLP